MRLVAGIDSSTQSTKVQLRDLETGAVVGEGRASHEPTVPPRSEQDPAMWWSSLVKAMQQAIGSTKREGAGQEVVALSVGAQQHGLVVLDPKGEVIRPAKLWNDTESSIDADFLCHRLSSQEWVAACGSLPVAAFTISKLAWLRRCEPESFKRIGRVLLPHDWLTYRLTGQFVTDRGDASGTGYWSPRENRYRIDLLSLVDEEVDWPELLPRVLGPWDVAGDLTAQSARELGLLPGIKVAPGTGDNMAGALGLGLRAGDVAVSIGTSGTVFATSDHPAQDPTGAVAGFADATGRFLPLVCTLNATLVTNAVARLLDVDFATLEKLALGAPAGSGGVTLVPYLAGERTPNRPEATGTLFGIRTDVSRELVARAAFEGVVCGLLEGLDALNVVGVPTTGQLLLIGGGAKSRAYREVFATLSNRSVVVPDETEIVAAGACVQAAIMESTSDVDAIVNSWSLGSGEIVEPGNGSLDAEGIRHRYASARG